MAIEGPLRELGIHDVFQLLDLSRKTGVLRVASELRDDEGVVYFDAGRVVHAQVRSKAMPLEMVLLQSGKISKDDIESARVESTSGRALRTRCRVSPWSRCLLPSGTMASPPSSICCLPSGRCCR